MFVIMQSSSLMVSRWHQCFRVTDSANPPALYSLNLPAHHQSQDVAPGGGPPRCSGYSRMKQRILFLLICIGKGLSWMAIEVKFKAQRSFEGQWEGRLMLGGSRDATLDRPEREPVGTCSFLTQEVNFAAAPAVCTFPLMR